MIIMILILLQQHARICIHSSGVEVDKANGFLPPGGGCFHLRRRPEEGSLSSDQGWRLQGC